MIAGAVVAAVVIATALHDGGGDPGQPARQAATLDRLKTSQGPASKAQSASSSTRLVGEPLLFRYVGHQPTRRGNFIISRQAYTVIFRLSRDPKPPGSTPGDVPRGSGTSRGSYKLAMNEIFFADAPIFTLGPSTPEHCFEARVPAGQYPDLDPLKIGERSRFELQPLTPTGQGGGTKLGRRYVTHPQLRATDIAFSRRTARHALAQLGCLKSALKAHGG